MQSVLFEDKRAMKYLRKERYDYFLIWGNGLPYKEDILNIIREIEFIKIIRIVSHKPKSIAKLVRTIYSYDYVPLQHLRSKTDYLLKTNPDVIIVFVQNRDAQETYQGEGEFRHLECTRIKSIKEEIRDKYNPRRNGKRTEEHVIHASDNELQVDHLLRYLGFREGLDLFRNIPNPILSLPYYLPKFEAFEIRQVDSTKLCCTIARGAREDWWTEVVQLEDTPHFRCLRGDRSVYNEYLSKFLGGPLTDDYSVQNLLALSRSLTYLEGPYAASYILARQLEDNRYLILDGVHRASILIFRGVGSFPVAVIR